MTHIKDKTADREMYMRMIDSETMPKKPSWPTTSSSGKLREDKGACEIKAAPRRCTQNLLPLVDKLLLKSHLNSLNEYSYNDATNAECLVVATIVSGRVQDCHHADEGGA